MNVELLVDTGATYGVLPASLLRKLGIKSVRIVKLRLVDNRVVEKPLGEVGIEIKDCFASAIPVVFDDNEIYLLGVSNDRTTRSRPDPIRIMNAPTWSSKVI